MAFNFENYINLSLYDKDRSDIAGVDIPALTQWADNFLSPIFDSFDSRFYAPNNGKLQLQWSTNQSFEAWVSADEKSDAPLHTVYITYNLIVQLAADNEAFTRYAINRLNKPMFAEIWKNKVTEKRGVGIYPFGIDPFLNRTFLFMHGLHWIVSHEIAHSMQSHVAVRSGVPRKSWMGPSHILDEQQVLESSSDLESEIFHCTELAADYEALRILVINMITSKRKAFHENLIKEELITKSDIWTLFVSIALVFLRFHNFTGKKFSAVLVGHHPHPSIRYFLLTQSLLGLMIQEDLKKIGGFDFSEEELATTLMESFWIALVFWSDRFEKGSEMINFGEVMVDPENPEVIKYLKKIVNRWDIIRPLIKENYSNEFLLMRFSIFVRRVTGIPVPSDQ